MPRACCAFRLFDTVTYEEEEYEEEQQYDEGEGEEYEGGGGTVTRTREVRKEKEAHVFGPLAAASSSKTVYDYAAEAQALASSGGDVHAAMTLLMADAEPQRQSVIETRLLQHLLIHESECSHATLTMLEAADVLEECGGDVRGAVAKVEGNAVFRERSDINKITDALAKQGLSVRPPSDEIRAELYRAGGDYDTALAATIEAWTAHEAAYDQVADMLSVTGKWRSAADICAALVAASFDVEAATVALTGIDDFATRVFPHAKVKHLLRDCLEYVHLEQSEIEATLADSGRDITRAFEVLRSQLKPQQKLFQLKEQLMQRLPWADVPLSELRRVLGKADQDMSKATIDLYDTWCGRESKFTELDQILHTVAEQAKASDDEVNKNEAPVAATDGVMCAALVKADFAVPSAAAIASGLDDVMLRYLNQQVRWLLEGQYGYVPSTVDDETINKRIDEAGGDAADASAVVDLIIGAVPQVTPVTPRCGRRRVHRPRTAEEARDAYNKAEQEAAAAAKAAEEAETNAKKTEEQAAQTAARADAAKAREKELRQSLEAAKESGDSAAIAEVAEQLKSAEKAANRAAKAATDAAAASEEAASAATEAQKAATQAAVGAREARATAVQVEANTLSWKEMTLFSIEADVMGLWNLDHPEVAVMVVGAVLDRKGGQKVGGGEAISRGTNYEDWEVVSGRICDSGDSVGTFSVLAQQKSTIVIKVTDKNGKNRGQTQREFKTEAAGTEQDVGEIYLDELHIVPDPPREAWETPPTSPGGGGYDAKEAERLAEAARLNELTEEMKEIFKVLEVWHSDLEISATITTTPTNGAFLQSDYDLMLAAAAITGEVGVVEKYRRLLVRKALKKLLRVDLGQEFQEALIEDSAIEEALRASDASFPQNVEDAAEAVRTSIIRAIEEKKRQAEMRKILGTVNAAVNCLCPLLLDGNDIATTKTLDELAELRKSAEGEDRPIEAVRMMEMELYTQLQDILAQTSGSARGQMDIDPSEDYIASFISEALTALLKKYSFVVATRTRNDDFDSARFWARKAEFLSAQAELFQDWVGRLRLRAVTLTNSGSLLRKQSQLVPAEGVLSNAAQIWKDAVQKAQIPSYRNEYEEGEEMSPEGASPLQRDAGLATFITYSAVLSSAGNHQGALDQAQTALSTAYKLASVSDESTYDAKFKALPAELNQAVVAACFCAGTARKALEAAPATRGAKVRTSVEWFRRAARISREAFGAKHVVTSSLSKRSKLQEPTAEDRLPGYFFISYKEPEIEPEPEDEEEDFGEDEEGEEY